MLLEAAYGEETGLGSPSFALNLENLSTENVLAFREKQFVASNIVVSGSGISQEKLEAAIAANENVLQKASVTALGKTAYSGGYVRVRKDLDGKTVVGLGFPVVSGVDSKTSVTSFFFVLKSCVDRQALSNSVWSTSIQASVKENISIL